MDTIIHIWISVKIHQMVIQLNIKLVLVHLKRFLGHVRYAMIVLNLLIPKLVRIVANLILTM